MLEADRRAGCKPAHNSPYCDNLMEAQKKTTFLLKKTRPANLIEKVIEIVLLQFPLVKIITSCHLTLFVVRSHFWCAFSTQTEGILLPLVRIEMENKGSTCKGNVMDR